MGIFFGRKGGQVYDAYANNTHHNWWRDPGLRMSVFIITMACAIQASSGVDKSLNTVQQSLPAWKKAMGNPNSESLGLITTSMYIAGFVSAIPSQQVMDRYGRRMSIIIGMALLIIGAAIETGAVNKGMFIAGRVIIGSALAFSTTVAPIIAQEYAHPRMRGTVATTYNTVYYVGAIAVSWVGFGTSYMGSNSWSWRIPALFQIVPALYIIAALPFLPESPRWLIANGREEEAFKILAKYHANGDETDELVLFEFHEMKEVLLREGREAVSWRTALSTPGNRKRFLMITAVSIFSNWNGQAIVSYYLASVLNLVGITSSTAQTGINGGLQVVNWVTSIFGASLAESAGRRKIWLSSWFVMLAANIILTSTTAVYTKAPTQGIAGAVIFAIFLYDVGYSLACTPLLYAYETEIMPFHLRAKGMAYSVTIGQGQAIIFQYCNPIGLAKLGWKYYLVFLVFLLIQIVVIYFYFIETSGRTLEEVAALFDGEDATKQIELAGANTTAAKVEAEAEAEKDAAAESTRTHVMSA